MLIVLVGASLGVIVVAWGLLQERWFGGFR